MIVHKRGHDEDPIASCVVFSRHPAAGFRSFDHHSRPSSSSGTTGLLDKKKENTEKNRNENETALKARRTTHVYVPKHDLRIVIIIPLFFRGCLSESPPRTLALFSC